MTFPKSIANQHAEQVFYYDGSFMQRRMDYSPDVTGNPPVAQYTHDPKTFDGFVFPTRRRVHLHDSDGNANQSFAAITVDTQASPSARPVEEEIRCSSTQPADSAATAPLATVFAKPKYEPTEN